MFKILIDTIRQLLKMPKMILLIYLAGFVLSMLVARPFYTTLINEADGSLAVQKLVQDFDFMIFGDFINQSGKALKPFISMIFVVGLLYLFVSAFLAGGILNAIATNQWDPKEFMAKSTQYFGRFCWLLFYLFVFLAAMVSLGGMFFFIFASIAEGGNERTYFWALVPSFMVLAFLVGFVVLVGEYAKAYVFTNQSTAWEGFSKAVGYIFKHLQVIWAFWLVIIISIIGMIIYLNIDKIIEMHSGFTIFIMFLIQQMFALFRVFLKTLNSAFALNYFLANK